MKNKSVEGIINENIIFSNLFTDDNAVWELMLASGYLKIIEKIEDNNSNILMKKYKMKLTNQEIIDMFEQTVNEWCRKSERKEKYNNFVEAILKNNVSDMQNYLQEILETVVSYHDLKTIKPEIEVEEKRWVENSYHILIIGLIIELRSKYEIKSNRESGYGRYDLALIPRDINKGLKSYIMEFKVKNNTNDTLEKLVDEALEQIKREKYKTDILDRGIPEDQIYRYAFAFAGKKVLVKQG